MTGNPHKNAQHLVEIAAWRARALTDPYADNATAVVACRLPNSPGTGQNALRWVTGLTRVSCWTGPTGGVTSAPIVVQRPSILDGRPVTVHGRGRDEILGTVYSDHDLVVFLEGAGVAEPDSILDDLQWVEWRDGPAHEFSAA